MKKKKVLLAIFASLCVAASASAIAACSDGGDARDNALYAAYQTYASSTDNPMGYDEWVADILEQLANGGKVGVEDVSIIEDENGNKCFLFTFTDGTSKTVPVDELVDAD